MLSISQIQRPIDCIQLNKWLQEISSGNLDDVLKAQLVQTILFNLKNDEQRTLMLFAELIEKRMFCLNCVEIKLDLKTPLQKVCIILSEIFKDQGDEFLFYDPKIKNLYVYDSPNREVLMKFCSKVLNVIYSMPDKFYLYDYIFDVLESIEYRVEQCKQDDLLKVVYSDILKEEEQSQFHQLLKLKFKISLSRISINPYVKDLSNVFYSLIDIMNQPQYKSTQLEAIRMLSLLIDLEYFSNNTLLNEIQKIVEKAFENILEKGEEQNFEKACRVLQDFLKIESEDFAEIIFDKYQQNEEYFHHNLEGMKLVVQVITFLNENKQYHKALLKKVLNKYIQQIALQNYNKYHIYFLTNFEPLLNFRIIKKVYPELSEFIMALEKESIEAIFKDLMKKIQNNKRTNAMQQAELYIRLFVIQQIVIFVQAWQYPVTSILIFNKDDSEFEKFAKGNLLVFISLSIDFNPSGYFWNLMRSRLIPELLLEQSTSIRLLFIKILMIQTLCQPKKALSIQNEKALNMHFDYLKLKHNQKLLNVLISYLFKVMRRFLQNRTSNFWYNFVVLFVKIVRFYKIREQVEVMGKLLSMEDDEEFELCQNSKQYLSNFISKLLRSEQFSETSSDIGHYFIKLFDVQAFYYSLIAEDSIPSQYEQFLKNSFVLFINCNEMLLINYMRKLTSQFVNEQCKKCSFKTNINYKYSEMWNQISLNQNMEGGTERFQQLILDSVYLNVGHLNIRGAATKHQIISSLFGIRRF